MASSSARKGKRFERELVRQAEAVGVDAQRAYASNGKALGEGKEADVVLEVPSGRRLTVQAKRRRNVAGYLTCESTDLVAVREDRGEALAVVPLDLLLELLQP